MSKQALRELLLTHPSKFNVMQKMMPASEKLSVLKFLKMRLELLENLK